MIPYKCFRHYCEIPNISLSSADKTTTLKRLKTDEYEFIFKRNPLKNEVIDNKILSHINAVYNLMEVDKLAKDNLLNILFLTHPFEKLKLKSKSTLIKPNIKLTNGYFKMQEFLVNFNSHLKELVKNNSITKETADVKINITNNATRKKVVQKGGTQERELKHFDIASAPGMFLVACDDWCRKNNIKYNWHACSISKDNSPSALGDFYDIYKNNISRYNSCDITDSITVNRILENHLGKYNLVTGDVGVAVDMLSNELKELSHLDVDYSQMILAIHLCAPNGITYLKTFTYTTWGMIYSVCVMRQYFDKVVIVKPYSSRNINFESYIIGIGRNSKKCTESLTLNDIPSISRFKQEDVLKIIRSIYEYESTRYDIAYDLVYNIVTELHKKPFIITNNKAKTIDPLYFSKVCIKYRPFYREYVKIVAKMFSNEVATKVKKGRTKPISVNVKKK